jgi:hypothetical protein
VVSDGYWKFESPLDSNVTIIEFLAKNAHTLELNEKWMNLTFIEQEEEEEERNIK